MGQIFASTLACYLVSDGVLFCPRGVQVPKISRDLRLKGFAEAYQPISSLPPGHPTSLFFLQCMQRGSLCTTAGEGFDSTRRLGRSRDGEYNEGALVAATHVEFSRQSRLLPAWSLCFSSVSQSQSRSPCIYHRCSGTSARTKPYEAA